VPEQVLRGVAMHYYEQADRAENPEVRQNSFREAAKYLGLLTKREDAKPDDFLNLGRSLLDLGDFKNAADPLDRYLRNTKEPIPRCVGLTALAQAQIGLRDFDAAQKAVDEALPLLNEGRLYALAKIADGDIQSGRGNFEAGAKRYEEISVLIDDEEVTPKALEKAIDAYEKAGKTEDAKRILNTLQSRYPEYFQRKRKQG